MDAAAIEHLAMEQISQLGMSTQLASQAILLHNGFYYGRQFQFADARAVWCAADKRLTIFAADGRPIQSIGADAPESNRQAA
jgi:hypothetical protein